MGLAASQCRLLFITQRQNDVSAKMQRISMDRLSLARDEDDIETKYNRMLNATRLEMSDGSNISYNAIMGTDAASRGSFHVLQNASGAVVLNSNLASKLGLNATSGTGSEYRSIHPNLASLVRQAEPTNAESILAANAKLTTDQVSSEKTKWEKSNLYKSFITNFGTMPPKGDQQVTLSMSSMANALGKIAGCGSAWNLPWDTANNDYLNHDANIKWGDLLDGRNKTVLYLDYWSKTSDSEDDKARSNNLSPLINGLANSVNSEFDGDAQFKAAVTTAKNETYNKFSAVSNADDTGHTDDAQNAAASQCKGKQYMGCCEATRGGHTNQYMYCVDAKEILKYFYQRLVVALGVSDNNHVTGNESISIVIKNAKNDKGYTYDQWAQKCQTEYEKWGGVGRCPSLPDGDEEESDEVVDPTSQAYFDNLKTYYFNLDRKLEACGWTTENDETIQNNLNSGFYYINGAAMSSASNIVEVADEESVKQAEAWYKAETKKIKRKEDAMDMENTKLQTEYQALATDIASVQQILNSNIQKSFQYCQSA